MPFIPYAAAAGVGALLGWNANETTGGAVKYAAVAAGLVIAYKVLKK